MLTIHRHKAAPRRRHLSAPIRQALAHGILTHDVTHLDYGCGYGTDVKILQAKGYNSVGYDPYYFPIQLSELEPDVVTMGYVLNVIECPVERDRTLVHAYSLAGKTLVVSASVGTAPPGEPYGDGVITSWKTFEKLFGCAELHNYIETVLGVSAKHLKQGIYAVEKMGSWQLLVEEMSLKELKKTLSYLEGEKEQLLQSWIPSPRAYLEVYSTAGYKYYHLRSPNRDLPGKRGLCKCLHLGELGSDRYNWGVDALKRREQLRIVNLRINRVLKKLS